MRSAWVSGLLLALFTLLWAPDLLGQHDSLQPPPDSVLISPSDSFRVVHHPIVPIESKFVKYVYPPGSRLAYSVYSPDSISLRQNPNGTVADVLAASGAGFVKVGAPGTLATSSIRGTDAAHLPVFWAGVPATSAMLGVSDLSLIPHTVLGPWSIALGGNSLFSGAGGLGGGLLMGLTSDRWFTYDHQHFSFISELGSFGTWKGGLIGDISTTKFYGKVAVYGSSSENNYPFLNTSLAQPRVEQLSNAAYQQVVATHEVQVPLRRRVWLSSNGWYQQAHRQLPAPMTSTTTGEFQDDESLRLSLGVHGRLKILDWTVKAVHLRDRLRYVHPIAGYDEPSSQDTWAGVASLSAETEVRRWLASHSLTARFMEALAETPSYGGQVRQPSASYSYSSSIYYQEKLALNLCLREERIEGIWSPLLATAGIGIPLAYIKRLGSFSVKANVARNYRFPTLNMRYWNPGGNPSLQPELSHTAEAGLQIGNKARANEGRLSREKLFFLSVVGYWSHVQNWIQWVPGPSGIWSPQNLRMVRSRGIESQLTLDRAKGKWNVEATLTHTFTDARTVESHLAGDPSLGKQLFYVPAHVASAGLMCRRKRTYVQVQQQLTGLRYTTPDNSALLPPFPLTHLSLGHTFRFRGKGNERSTAGSTHDVSLQCSVNNLLNTTYQVIPWRPMPGRSFSISLLYDFSHGLDL